MKNLFLTSLLLLAAVSSRSASADEKIMTGKVLEKIDATSPLSAVFLPGIGLSASPSPKSNEVNDAFSEFADPRAAMKQIEALKKKHGFSGGTVFAGFTYDSDRGSQLNFICGISSSNSGSLDEVREKGVEYGVLPGANMPFAQFKLASHEERVRAIAGCLASMTEMPKLQPTHPALKKVYIDEASYRLGELWLRSKDPEGARGTSAQYRQEFLCLVSGAAMDLHDATGESVVFRTVSQTDTREIRGSVPNWAKAILPKGAQQTVDYEDFQTRIVYLSVLNDHAARATWNAKDDDDIFGLWPTSIGLDGITTNGTNNPLEQALGPSFKNRIAGCHRQAGLFELPLARLPDPSPVHCAN